MTAVNRNRNTLKPYMVNGNYNETSSPLERNKKHLISNIVTNENRVDSLEDMSTINQTQKNTNKAL